jgi:hypothetical protein
MNIPQFTAQASLYRTSNRYRSSVAKFDGSPFTQSVIPALNDVDRANCDGCEQKCNNDYAVCARDAVIGWTAGLLGCAFSGPLYPICASAASGAYAIAIGVCSGVFGACEISCNSPGRSSCCPVFCELGHCCSHGETCVPHGCCPSNQVVCGGECCGVGESCCGDTCCPPNYYCIDEGFCSEFPSAIPFGNPPPPPPPPVSKCSDFGLAPCGSHCCYAGLQCCGVDKFTGQPDCRTSCVH